MGIGTKAQLFRLGNIDFVLAFYMVREVRDQAAFFHEIGSILKPGGQVLVTEPPLHVSKRLLLRRLIRPRPPVSCKVPGQSYC
ncbi:MAG TPA: hypothetical protein DDY20_07270 [Desulfobulbaceae bacterium]|nr:hypothetical protein [Desulfobulbaceae bacterium]